jgi:uncharacterized protein YycO
MTKNGGLAVEDTNGKGLASAVPPVMWDSSSDDPSVAAVETSVERGETKDGVPQDIVVLEPSTEFLTDPSRVYPVIVDPTYSMLAQVDTWVSTKYPSSQGGSSELRAGRNDEGQVARSYLKFPGESVWNGTRVVSATLTLRNWSSVSCGAQVIRAQRLLSEFNSNTVSWDTQPVADTAADADFNRAFGGPTCPDVGDAVWNLTSMVQSWASNTHKNYGVRLRAYDETNANSFRRYRSLEFGKNMPTLAVTYNRYPNTASAAIVSPSDWGYVTSTTPTLSASVVDPDGGTVRIRFEITTATGGAVWTGHSSAVASGTTAALTVPSGILTEGASYVVRAKGVDLYDESRSWSAPTAFTVDSTAGAPADPEIQEILELDPTATEESVVAGIEDLVEESQIDSELETPLTFDDAKDSVLVDLTEVSEEVTSEQERVEGELATGSPGAGDVMEADPGEDAVVEMVPAEAEPVEDIAYAAASSPTGGTRIRLPAAKRYGDIVVAPNKTKYFPHGHAAIFTSYNYIAQAVGEGYKLQVVNRESAAAKIFAPGAKMMSVYTDEGDGPLLSLEKRLKAVDWAKSRAGDQYRSWTKPNAFRVSGSVGSDNSRQNCSQLVWGAYNYANGYNFNPVPAWKLALSPTVYYADKKYVHPFELTDAPQTRVYRTVYTDLGK